MNFQENNLIEVPDYQKIWYKKNFSSFSLIDENMLISMEYDIMQNIFGYNVRYKSFQAESLDILECFHLSYTASKSSMNECYRLIKFMNGVYKEAIKKEFYEMANNLKIMLIDFNCIVENSNNNSKDCENLEYDKYFL